MIKKALQFTSDMLSQFLSNKLGLDDKMVLINNVIDADGTLPQINQNKIIISLINIEKETSKPFYKRQQPLENGNFADVNPTERYNLDILITSNFDEYSETLTFLNSAILFFQIHNCLDSATSSSFPVGLSKLEFDIEKISYFDMHSLWSSMGAKYQPSVIYKLRLISIQGNQPDGFTNALLQSTNQVNA